MQSSAYFENSGNWLMTERWIRREYFICTSAIAQLVVAYVDRADIFHIPATALDFRSQASAFSLSTKPGPSLMSGAQITKPCAFWADRLPIVLITFSPENTPAAAAVRKRKILRFMMLVPWLIDN
jgi:hypothetical protein